MELIDKIPFDLQEGELRLKVAFKNIMYAISTGIYNDFEVTWFNMPIIQQSIDELGIKILKETMNNDYKTIILSNNVVISYNFYNSNTKFNTINNDR